jgi:hypothetical protein
MGSLFDLSPILLFSWLSGVATALYLTVRLQTRR